MTILLLRLFRVRPHCPESLRALSDSTDGHARAARHRRRLVELGQAQLILCQARRSSTGTG